MAIEKQIYTAEQFWAMAEVGQFENRYYERIEGMIREMPPFSCGSR